MPRSTYKPLKVLMLASSYPRSKEDSASIFLRHLAESLSQRGIKVHVLIPADNEWGTRAEGDIIVHRFRYFPKRLQKLAYGSGILPNLSQNRWLWTEVPFFLAAMTFSLLRLISKQRPDLIHAHWVLPQGLIAVLAKLLYKLPVITTAHGGDAFALRAGLMRKLKRLVLRRGDAWTANTHATARAFAAEGAAQQPYIIPMGVDVEYFGKGCRSTLRSELPGEELLVLFVGRLVEKKGVDDLLAAFSLLSAELRARTTLWVVGEGESHGNLRQCAEGLGIIGKVRFWGHITNYRLPDFYAAADLFVVPSIEATSGDTEGQGVVLLEAFAARLCVLATSTGGIPEVVDNGYTGILVEPRNPQQLSVAMEKLLRDRQLREKLANNAFARVKNYDWEKIAEELEGVYRAIL